MVHGNNLVTLNDDQLYNINIQKVNQRKSQKSQSGYYQRYQFRFVVYHLFRKKKVGRVPGLIQLNFNRFNQLINHFRLNQRLKHFELLAQKHTASSSLILTDGWKQQAEMVLLPPTLRFRHRHNRAATQTR